jgi:hypothetical protein
MNTPRHVGEIAIACASASRWKIGCGDCQNSGQNYFVPGSCTLGDQQRCPAMKNPLGDRIVKPKNAALRLSRQMRAWMRWPGSRGSSGGKRRRQNAHFAGVVARMGRIGEAGFHQFRQ